MKKEIENRMIKLEKEISEQEDKLKIRESIVKCDTMLERQ